MATFRHKKSVEEHYKGTNPQEKVRGNSAEHFSSMKHKALKAKTGGFDHEQHAKHNRNIEAIDKKFGIGVHDPKRFK